MEKKCNCECHQLHPIPCMFCAGRHEQSPELGPVESTAFVEQLGALRDEDDHDEKTEPGAHFTGFPF